MKRGKQRCIRVQAVKVALTLLCVLPEAELAFGVSGGTQSREKLWLGTAKGQHPLCVLSGVLCPLKLLSCFSPLCRHPLEVQGAVQHGLFREVVAKKRGCKVSPALFSPFSWGALERWQLRAFGAIPVSRRGFGTPPCPPVLLSTTPYVPLGALSHLAASITNPTASNCSWFGVSLELWGCSVPSWAQLTVKLSFNPPSNQTAHPVPSPAATQSEHIRIAPIPGFNQEARLRNKYCLR